jgi:hypothetical protein
MTLPFTLPAWVPWWVQILVLVPVLFYALLLVAMPFSVIGLRGRLANIDARLDEIQGEIRTLALRLPEPTRSNADRPPIAPVAERARPSGRAEPKLNWPS